MPPAQRPIQLILARNLLASLHTAAFLVDNAGEVVFYNEAAGMLLGRRFEECGPMPAAEWTTTFGPFREDGSPQSFEEIGLTRVLRHNRPAHAEMRIRSERGVEHDIEASALPIAGDDGFQGAMVFFWSKGED